MSSSLVCSCSGWPSWLPEEGSCGLTQSISPDTAMKANSSYTFHNLHIMQKHS